MTPEQAETQLNEYLQHLNDGDFKWCIPRQDVVHDLVSKLTRGTSVWPVMGGTYWPSDYPAVQGQRIEAALVNLRNDSTMLVPTPSEDPWEATADRLDAIADRMPDTAWYAEALEAQQLVAYISPEAAKQIGDMVEKHTMFGDLDYSGARGKVVAVIRGAAAGVRLHGPLPPPSSPLVSVEQQMEQHQQVLVPVVSIEALLRWEDLPADLRPDLESMKAAKDAGDMPGLMKRASDFATQAAAFPELVDKIGDAFEWVKSLL